MGHAGNCLHEAYSLKMGRLLTGVEAALHRRHLSCHHHWLPCMVGPPCYAIFFGKGLKQSYIKAINQCLRTIAGAYKATPTQSLQAEVGVPLLPLHLDGRQARF